MDRKWKSGALGIAPDPALNASDGFPTPGNPGGGVPASKPGAYWYYMVTEEILAVITAAGIAFDKTVITQLRDAIQALKSNLDSFVRFSGIISPAQLTANTNDWNPAGLATSSTIRFSTDASRNITGLAGGAAGRMMRLHNVGAQPAVLQNQNAGSTAANRFLFTADLTLLGNETCELQYDATTSNWRLVASGKNIPSAAVQADQEAASSTSLFVSPGTQKMHPSAAKAWAKSNPSGTTDAAFGVTSISDDSIGAYTIAWATAFSSANYAVNATVRSSVGGSAATTLISQIDGATFSTTNCKIWSLRVSDGAGADPSNSHMMSAYGDQ